MPSPNRHGVPFLIAALAAVAVPHGAGAQPKPPSADGGLRWTAATPDAMVDASLARAGRAAADPGTTAQGLAALVVAVALDERAGFGRTRAGLDAVAGGSSPVADDARWLRKELEPAPPGEPWPGSRAVAFEMPADRDGLLRSFAVLGPFQDNTGEGLVRREGPEAPGQSFADPSARYSWGVFDVAWRRVLPAVVTARGVPLDLYVHPRSESCTWLASKVTLPQAQPIVLHVASSGAFRLVWDGADVAIDDEVHRKMVLDRRAVRVEASSGAHLVAVKVCSAAIGDEGRVRVRVTDEARRPIPVASSSDLRGLAFTPPAVAAAPAKKPAKQPTAKAPGPAKKPGAGKEPSAPSAAATLVLPQGVTRVPTSLERALDVGAEPGVDRLLAAVVLRTLGGADDVRSPRAPGMLDRVTRAAGLSADALAMAGWVSPFGANRSGWLNLARERAGRENDAATAAFAQRRLAASHMGMPDWAMANVRQEPLASAGDVEARIVRALAKKQLGAEGLAKAALDDLVAIAESEKDKTPIAVWAEIADLARANPQLSKKAQQRLAEVRAEGRGPAWVRAHKPEGGAALEVAAARALGSLTSIDEVIAVGRELEAAERWPWAREVYYWATQIAPNRSAGFRGLATARQAAAALEERRGGAASGDEPLVAAALGRARDLEPGDPLLKAELGWRARPGGAAAGAADHEAMADERFLVAPEVFLARAKKSPVHKGQIFDRQLHWIRVVTYHPDKRVSQLMQYAREVVVEPRTEAERVEAAMPAEGDETELLTARLFKKDGTVLQPEEQSAGGSRPFVRWPKLETGDIVEVTVRSWTSGPVGRRGDPPFYFIDYVGATDTHPILYNEVVVDSPAESPLAVDVLNGKVGRTTTETKNGRLVTRLVWDDPGAVADEPLAPELTESLPVVVGSTFHGWNEFREWYRGAVKGFTAPDDQVRRLAAELTKGKKTRDEKIRALFDFVADDIRYVNFVSGEWWLPNRPQELLARRQGDCDDKALLLITLLKAIGIDATEVLVQTRYTGSPSLLRSEKVAIPRFDHGIAYLPGVGGKPGIWLDATSPQSRLGPLPSMDARAVALFVDEGPAKIVDTPSSSPDEHGVDATWKIRVDATGAGELGAEERHTGDAAFELRINLEQPDARAQWLEQMLASGWFPTVQITGDVDFKADLPNGAATLRYTARSEGLARREGDELAVPVAEITTLTSQLAPLVKRTLPVVLPSRLAPSHDVRTIVVEAPPGFEVAELPPSGEEAAGELGRARIEFARAKGKGNAVTVKRTLVFDLSTIPVDKYARWRAWLQRVDGLMHRTVRFVPTKKP